MEGELNTLKHLALPMIVLFYMAGSYLNNTYCFALVPALTALPNHTIQTMTGNLLGDGHLRYSNYSRDGKMGGNARYEMTMSVKAYDYMLDLYNTYSSFSTKSGLNS